MLYLRRLGKIFPAGRAGVDHALRTSDQEFQRPDVHVRRCEYYPIRPFWPNTDRT